MANDITLNILGNAKGAAGAFAEVERMSDSLNRKFSEVGKSMMDMGSKMTLGLTLPIAGLGALAFKSASELQDNIGAVSAVYGDSAADIEAWAATTTDAFGVSKQDALGYAGVMGNVLTAIGFSSDEAADMSKSMIALAGDMASFSGTSPEEAFEALQAATTGEMEQLKKYGIVLNEETIKQKAMEMGLSDGKGTLDAHSKALAVNALVMERGKNMIGDYSRTSDGANNTMNTAKAKFEDLTATLGTKLLPIGTQIIDWLSKVAEWFTSLPDNVQTFILVGGGLVAILGPIITGLGAVAAAIGAIGLPVIAVVAAIAALGAGLYWLYQNNETFRNSVQAVWDWIQTTAIPAAQEFWNTLVTGASVIIGWVQEKWPQFQLGLQRTFDWLQTNVLPIVTQVVGFVIQTFMRWVTWAQENLPKFQEAFSHVFNVVSGIVTWVMENIVSRIQMAWDFITMITQGWGDNLGGIIGAVWEQIKSTVSTVIGVIQNIIEFVMNIINGDWSAAWENVKSILGLAVDWLAGSVGRLWDIIKNLFGMGIDALKNLWSWVWTWVKDFVSQKIDEAVTNVRGAWDTLVGFVTSMPSRISGALSGLWDGLKDGFRSAVNGVIGLWNNLSFTTPSIDVPGLGQVGGKRVDFPDIPYLKDGGSIMRSGWAVVGDAGPELLNLNAGAQVRPLPTGGGMTDAQVDRIIAAMEENLGRPNVSIESTPKATAHDLVAQAAFELQHSGR